MNNGMMGFPQGAGQDADTPTGLGYDQSWQMLTSKRVGGVTYYNDTDQPIFVAVYFSTGGSATGTLTINGVTALQNAANAYYNAVFGIVPVGHSYVFTGASVSAWTELRALP